MRKLKPTDTAIPVFLAGDDSYAPYIGTCLHSILENSSARYVFYILVPAQFTQAGKQLLQKLTRLYPNCRLKFINMGESFRELKQKIAHIAYPTYYRLLIAEKFPEIEKCIYLDADTIICGDLAGLYNQNISGYYLGAVKAPYVYLEPGGPAFLRSIGLRGTGSYFNAGVLLMNLREIRADRLTAVFLKLTERRLPTQDQDILNIACRDKVKLLDFKYNCMTKYFPEREKLYTLFSRKQIEAAYREPVIIHYCDSAKPWHFPLTGHFWLSIRRSPFYADILARNMQARPPAKPQPGFWAGLLRGNSSD